LLGGLFILVLIILMFFRMWVGAAMLVIGFFGYFILAGPNKAFANIATTPYNTLYNYTLTAVPMFVLMGEIISVSGIGTDLYNTAYKWLGQLRGGLAMGTVAACALFAAICGVSGAEILSIGKVALPEMKKFHYSDSLRTASVACAGTLGILIPPSIGFLVYGIITEQSVGMLFMAGILPGILLASLFVITILVITGLNPNAGPAGPKTTIVEKVVSLKRTWPVLVLFVLVLGGIYMGIFTPTEAGAVGSVGAIVITVVNRQLTFRKLFEALWDTTIVSALICILIIGAFTMMHTLAISKLPFGMAEIIGGMQVSRYLVFAAIVLLYIVLGMFLDIFSAIILTVPLLYPMIIALGFDPIWFGVQMVVLMQMGLVTPPVGMDVFMLSTITEVPMGTIFKGVWPFVAAILLCIVILTIFPQIALFIPYHMMS
jgi:C4-dicarboxylate transporter DctM subunit